VVLKGVDAAVVQTMAELDPAVKAAKVEFVGPTVGKQLRDDGTLAVGAALLLILVYIAFRFDIYFAPGAILCLFHDAIVTMAVLALIGEQFSLATIAGILTLVGYSINDTIVVFDRIRETMGTARGAELKDVVNRSVNETLGRTVMTAGSTLLACVCLMVFGRGTVLASFGLIMTIGIVLGTYSSVYVAAPVFVWLRENYGPKEDPSTKTPPRDRSIAVV
jgi:preprotein translocase subunit SecF